MEVPELIKGLMTTTENFFDSKISQSALFIQIAGWGIIIAGLCMISMVSFYRLKDTRVVLKVINLHTEYPSRNDEKSRDAEDKPPLIRPEFEIINGPHQGILALSSSASNSAEHNIGEITQGYFFVGSGDVISKQQSHGGLKFALIFILCGIFTLAFVRFMTG